MRSHTRFHWRGERVARAWSSEGAYQSESFGRPLQWLGSLESEIKVVCGHGDKTYEHALCGWLDLGLSGSLLGPQHNSAQVECGCSGSVCGWKNE